MGNFLGYSLSKKVPNAVGYCYRLNKPVMINGKPQRGGYRSVTKLAVQLGYPQTPISNKELAKQILKEASEQGLIGQHSATNKIDTGNNSKAKPGHILRDFVIQVLAKDSLEIKYLNSQKLHEYSSKTLQKYNCSFKCHAYNLLSSAITVENVKVHNIKNLIHGLKEKGCSNDVINNCRDGINLALHYAEEVGIIEENPCKRVHKLKTESAERYILTKPEVKKILEIMSSVNDKYSLKTCSERAYLAVKLAVYTGMRSGEIRALKIENIKQYFNPDKNESDIFTISVSKSWSDPDKMSSPTKGRYNRKVYIFGNFAKELFDLYKKNPYKNGFIFWSDKYDNQPIAKSTLTNNLYDALERVGISEEQRRNRKIDFQSLRHFYDSMMQPSSEMIKTRKLVMESIGHKSTRIDDNYLHETYYNALYLATLSNKMLE